MSGQRTNHLYKPFPIYNYYQLITMKINVLLSAGLFCLMLASLTGCNKDETVATTPLTRLTATATGMAEKPTSNTSTATGTFTGDLNEATRVLSYTVTYSGLTPTAGHLHRVTAANGTGGVEIGFGALTSPITGTATLTTQTRVDSLKNGFYYVNLHTTRFPGGEIRGDIKR